MLGLNGSGKSTLLKIMAGLDTNIEGEARPQPNIKVGYLPQEPELDPKKTVRQEVVHDFLAHGLLGIELGLLRQVTHLDVRLGTRLALDVGIETRHDLEQRRFARAVEAEHADLGAWEERQADVAEDLTLGGTILPTRFIV